MKKKYTRWLTLSLVTALAITTAACGKSSDTKTSDTNKPSAAASSGSKPTLRSLQLWMKEDYNTYPVAKLLEERTGYKVQYETLPQGNASDEKLNLLMASGEAYDAVTLYGTNDQKALYSEFAKQGALTDLGPLIEKYGPNIKTAISQDTLDTAKVNGKIYAIFAKASPSSNSSLMIRQDWLDKLGLKVPATTDELVAVLKAFKDKDPGGNGDKNIPLTLNWPFIDSVVGAFGLENSWNVSGGKLVPRVLDPAYKDYVAFVTDLFKQGLLDKEFAVNKDATMKEKFSSGRAGIMSLAWFDVPSINETLKKNQPGAKLVYIPALKGPSGKQALSASAGYDRITFIPKASKHPEDTIKWINAKLDKETFKLMAIGEEGKHYTFKDGAYTPILPAFVDERNRAGNYMMGIDETNYPNYWQARVRKDQNLFEAWGFLNIKEPANTRVQDPLANSPYLPEFTKSNTSLNLLVSDQTVKYIFGADSLTNLEAFQTKFKASGGDASVKEVNDWYANSKKKK